MRPVSGAGPRSPPNSGADPFSRPVETPALGYERAPWRASVGELGAATPADARRAAGSVPAARRRAARPLARVLEALEAILLLRPRSRMDRKAPLTRKTGAAKSQQVAQRRAGATCTTAQPRVTRRDGSPSGSAPSESRRGTCREWCSRRLSKFSATNSRHRLTRSIRTHQRP